MPVSFGSFLVVDCACSELECGCLDFGCNCVRVEHEAIREVLNIQIPCTLLCC